MESNYENAKRKLVVAIHSLSQFPTRTYVFVCLCLLQNGGYGGGGGGGVGNPGGANFVLGGT